jgi:hypothetical protein
MVPEAVFFILRGLLTQVQVWAANIRFGQRRTAYTTVVSLDINIML